MFPEPVANAIRDAQSTTAHRGDPTGAKNSTHAAAADGAAASPKQIRAALRIRAALTAARLDASDDRLPDDTWRGWTWVVKAFPRPPLVFDNAEELNIEEFLANDSLGG